MFRLRFLRFLFPSLPDINQQQQQQQKQQQNQQNHTEIYPLDNLDEQETRNSPITTDQETQLQARRQESLTPVNSDDYLTSEEEIRGFPSISDMNADIEEELSKQEELSHQCMKQTSERNDLTDATESVETCTVNHQQHPQHAIAEATSPSNSDSEELQDDYERTTSDPDLDGSTQELCTSSEEDSSETSTTTLEKRLLDSIKLGRREQVRDLLKCSSILQVLLTFSYANRPVSVANTTKSCEIIDGKLAPGIRHSGSRSPHLRNSLGSNSGNLAPFQPELNFDPDILQEAHELLGTSVSPLNFLQIACVLGEEEIAKDLLEYVHRHTKHKKLLMMEFLGKTWGDGNTSLHLASFQGMSEIVQELLDYGANSNKRNGRGYKVTI